MHHNHHKKRIHFYRHSKLGYLLRVLTVDDVSYWGASSLVSVIFALFVVAQIQGATAVHVGLALTVREVFLATLSIPIGKMLDKHKGYIDELYVLSASGFLVGTSYILLSLSDKIWELFVVMSLIGIANALNLNAWRVLFYGSISEKERGETTGVYQTIMSITGAGILALGGFIGDYYGLNMVLVLGGLMSIVGGVLPFFVLTSVKQQS